MLKKIQNQCNYVFPSDKCHKGKHWRLWGADNYIDGNHKTNQKNPKINFDVYYWCQDKYWCFCMCRICLKFVLPSLIQASHPCTFFSAFLHCLWHRLHSKPNSFGTFYRTTRCEWFQKTNNNFSELQSSSLNANASTSVTCLRWHLPQPSARTRSVSTHRRDETVPPAPRATPRRLNNPARDGAKHTKQEKIPILY